ncbi:MAG: putative proteasome accessory factor [Actinomycetota bacterium]|jgi:proteasome accessory factor C
MSAANTSGRRKRGPRGNAERVRGLLVMLPWLAGRGTVSVAEMARQFGMTEEALIADLELASMCGVPPYSPAELTDLWVEDGIIHVGHMHLFDRRLDMSASEAFGLALLAAAARDLPGFRASRALKSALAKIAKVMGDSVVAVDVETPEHLSAITAGAESGERLRITYWTPGRNEVTERTITVRAVFADRGHWYVTAEDGLREAVRHFRVDRIRSVEGTGEHVPVAPETPSVPDWFADAEGRTRVTLEVGPEAAWIVETYPCEVIEERADGTVVARVVATSEHWLGRLLLRGRGEVRVTEPAEMTDLDMRTARQVLERYRTTPGS